MTVQELIDELSKMDPNHEVIFRYVGTGFNHDNPIESAKVDIVGGPYKADERMAVVLR